MDSGRTADSGQRSGQWTESGERRAATCGAVRHLAATDTLDKTHLRYACVDRTSRYPGTVTRQHAGSGCEDVVRVSAVWS